MEQTPTAGRIVNYSMSPTDCQSAVIFTGNLVQPGDVLPMIIVKVWPGPEHMVNGQVFLDGQGMLWVTSVKEGEGHRTWAWPTRT